MEVDEVGREGDEGEGEDKEGSDEEQDMPDDLNLDDDQEVSPCCGSIISLSSDSHLWLCIVFGKILRSPVIAIILLCQIFEPLRLLLFLILIM